MSACSLQLCKRPACPPATAADGLQVKVTPKHYSASLSWSSHLDLKPVTSDCTAL